MSAQEQITTRVETQSAPLGDGITAQSLDNNKVKEILSAGPMHRRPLTRLGVTPVSSLARVEAKIHAAHIRQIA